MIAYAYAKPAHTILDDRIMLSRKTTKTLIYYCDNLPLKVEILIEKENEQISETGSVSSALELFQTILTFTD